jgi:hypothetical protein
MPIHPGMRRRPGKHVARTACRHWRKTVANNSGLQFVICRSCKQVSVRYLHAVLEDDIELPGDDLYISQAG